MLPGDLLHALVRRRNVDAPLAVTVQGQGDRPEGDFNPETLAEFLAYDILFRTSPAFGFLFPPQVRE